MTIRHPSFRSGLLAVLGLVASAPAAALVLSLGEDGSINGVLNTSVSLGAAWRMEEPAADLIGKANLNPDLCGGRYQSCQGLFKDQIYPSQRLAAAPGQYSMHNDDGNLNYSKGDAVQAVAKITQDLNLTYRGFGFFTRWLYFYDFVNNDFTEYHPNRITPQNVNQVATRGHPESNRYFPAVYGRGAVVRNKRRDGETLKEIGTDLQLLDANVYGKLPLWNERELSFKIGRQTVNWGESTLLVINSINQANPVNANNLFRVGFTVEEVFTPVGMLFASFEPFDNATLEAFYQYEWQPVEAPAPGGYFSNVDIGTHNAGRSINYTFGTSPDDLDRAFAGNTPSGQMGYLDNPLTLVSPTTTTFLRGKDREPRDGGQYGIALKYYAENFNDGTELGFYFMNYHSQLPYTSFISARAACARREGNPLNLDAYDTSSFLQACPNLPLVNSQQAMGRLLVDAAVLAASRPAMAEDLGTSVGALPSLLPGNPNAPFSSLVALDSPVFFLEYPEDLRLFGLSFNTTLGDYSLQGEIAYRPDAPLQVALPDLGFAAQGPTLTRCHDPELPRSDGTGTGCRGSSAGTGFHADGSHSSDTGTGFYGASDFVVDANGTNPYRDTVNLVAGHLPGSARSFPNFIIPYRGGVIGENPPESYIRGYERFDTYQFNLGFTRVLGPSENPLGADQIQLLGELGASWVPDLPPLDRLQIEAPGVYTSATAGADGSGADRSRQACSTNPTCSLGPDGLRFNPHQADLDAYVDQWSWGYRLISIVKYESVWPGISFQPFIVWAHDVGGTSPGPAENFVEGRKQALANLETRYKEALSFTVGYGWFSGGGASNVYHDRDFAQAFVRYQF